MEGVLPASQTISAPDIEARRRFLLGMAALVLLLMLYTFGVGLGILNGRVPLTQMFLLMALPCIVPICWYGYGFLKIPEAEQDFGLLLSALGWALTAIALLIRHRAVVDAIARLTATATAGDVMAEAGFPLAARICGILALLCLLAGAALSWHAWTKERS